MKQTPKEILESVAKKHGFTPEQIWEYNRKELVAFARCEVVREAYKAGYCKSTIARLIKRARKSVYNCLGK